MQHCVHGQDTLWGTGMNHGIVIGIRVPDRAVKAVRLGGDAEVEGWSVRRALREVG